MNTDKSKQPEKKPDETALGSVAAHLVIRDKKTGKEIVNRRG